ncbi:lmo0937 family membrane protein [Massilia varians]|nr:lmo0937 family membrane protein [Massilia varians]
MLYTIAIVLLVLWVLGMLTSVAGGLIHLLLVVAAVVILIRLFTGRKVL